MYRDFRKSWRNRVAPPPASLFTQEFLPFVLLHLVLLMHSAVVKTPKTQPFHASLALQMTHFCAALRLAGPCGFPVLAEVRESSSFFKISFDSFWTHKLSKALVISLRCITVAAWMHLRPLRCTSMVKCGQACIWIPADRWLCCWQLAHFLQANDFAIDCYLHYTLHYTYTILH